MAPDCPLDMAHELLWSSEVLAGFPPTPVTLSLLTSLPQAGWITPRSYSLPSKPSRNYSHCLEYSLPFLLSSSPPCVDLTCTHPCFNFKGLSVGPFLTPRSGGVLLSEATSELCIACHYTYYASLIVSPHTQPTVLQSKETEDRHRKALKNHLNLSWSHLKNGKGTFIPNIQQNLKQTNPFLHFCLSLSHSM